MTDDLLKGFQVSPGKNRAERSAEILATQQSAPKVIPTDIVAFKDYLSRSGMHLAEDSRFSLNNIRTVLDWLDKHPRMTLIKLYALNDRELEAMGLTYEMIAVINHAGLTFRNAARDSS
ncbi:hypothetical protein KBD71_01265 [Candidatus Woesebacteria bacterium]|nr:hypothetical protein [Candidatus Woesebacteria bacterium]